MKVTARRTERKLSLRLDGELDHHAAREVMAEIDRHLDVALPLRKRMQNLSGSMYVSHVPPQAYRVLEAAGIGRIVAIEQEGGE